jgi:hypothetical protein
MRIRTLVPALACLAAAPLATAADSTSVKIDGFVDTILSSYSVVDSDPSGAKDSNTAFSYAAKLGFAATISEKVAAQVDAVISGSSLDSASTDSNGDPIASDQIAFRQAFGTWKITPDIELKTGKFISNYGWVAAYAPGLYRIGAGPIVGFYGVDQIGADVKYSKDAITAAVTLANGFFGEGDNASAQSGSDQKDQSMALGVDVVYSLADKGSVNVEAVYDMEANPTGGDGIHFGVNATLTPSEPITVGAELIYQTVGGADGTTEEDISHLGLLAMVNYKLGSALPVPASVTGMVQYASVDNAGFVKDDTETSTEISVALLTNPAGTDKLGANFEIAYAMDETEVSSVSTESSTITLSAELLYVF